MLPDRRRPDIIFAYINAARCEITENASPATSDDQKTSFRTRAKRTSGRECQISFSLLKTLPEKGGHISFSPIKMLPERRKARPRYHFHTQICYPGWSWRNKFAFSCPATNLCEGNLRFRARPQTCAREICVFAALSSEE